MNKNTLYFVLVIYVFMGCKPRMNKGVPPNTIVYSEKINDKLKKMYDSIVAFQDVDWVTYKGVGEELSETTKLAYPFSVFCYKGGYIDLLVYFDEDNVIKRRVRSLFSKFDFSYCFYYSHDSKDTMAMCDYFLDPSKKISFVIKKSMVEKGQFEFGSFTIHSSDASILRSTFYSMEYRRNKYILEEVLSGLKKGNYPSEYDVYQEQHFQIIEKKFYKVYDKRIDIEFKDETRESKKKFLQYESETKMSFFYHYIKLFSYCKGF